jgi:FAD/FMN-containing dehydrogenase
MSDLEHELRRRVEGDVRFDHYSRLLYSTDASMYQMEPIGVVIPRHADDVQAAIEVANQLGAPLLPRGGGTSLTGQTVNHAVVLDFSRHMGNVLEVNREELWARVQPGLVQDELNHHVRSMGLLFGPDTSTSNRATIGGMLGNNSGGSHSIAYGLTVEHVIEMTTILADGSRAVFGEVTPAQFAAKMRLPGLEGQIYQEVDRIRTRYDAEIRTKYPRHWRRVCGYNLDELVKDRPLNMARLIVGSEGTFVTVVEAKMRLVEKPKATAVDVIHYHDMQEALESSQAILETGPYAVELTDKMILDLARMNIEQAGRMGFVQGDPAAILMVEYAGETEQEVKAKVADLEARRTRGRFGYASHIATDSAEQQSIWKLRKAGLGLLLGTRGESKPIAFIEDTAVDPKHLPEFVPRFTEIMAKHGADAAYYGHCSVGCLHIRPLINLKTERGLEQVRVMAEEIFDLVLSFGGAISSEHGDGRARSPFLERVFGPVMFQAFRETKAAFDPRGLMNPGNIVGSPGVTEHLRYGARYKTWEPKTLLDFSAQGGFAAAVEMCNGVGVCRKKLEGTMCPSYMATRDEEHSTRGRANALRAVLSGQVPATDFAGKRLYEVMDLCLECKGCKAECPSNVDMAKMKYEFLHHYHAVNGLPLRNRLFGHIARLSWLGSRLAPISNWIARSWPNRLLMERIAGIDRRRPLPAFARETFTDWFDGRRAPAEAPRGDRAGRGGAAGDGRLPGPARGQEVLRPAAHLQGNAGRGQGARRVERGAPAALGGPGRGHRRARALVPAHPAGRDGGAGAHRRGAARGRLRLPPGGVPAARARAGPHAPLRAQRPRAQAGAAPRPLPSEGDGRYRAHGGRAPMGRLRGGRGGLGLLRHGRLLRLRARALRRLGDAGQPASRPRGEVGGGRDRDRGAGRVLPPADRAPGGPPRQAPRPDPARSAPLLSPASRRRLPFPRWTT